MNQELLQFNKENYIVTNENGQIDFIRTTCGSNNTEIILEKENLLEEYGNELKKCNNDIERLPSKIKKTKRKRNLFFLLTLVFGFNAIVLIRGLFSTNLIYDMIIYFVSLGIDISFGILPFSDFDTNRKKLNKHKSELSFAEQTKKELNVKIPMLEKELKNLKEQVSYKRFNAEIVENRGLDSFQLSEPKTSYKKRVLRK